VPARRRVDPVVASAALVGAVLGYAAERTLVRPRLHPAIDGPPLGSLAGELVEVRGPDGLRVAVERYGPEGAPQLVLAHGWTNTGRVWHEQVAGLADRYRIVTYDQPGHGRTSPPRSRRYSIDLLGDTLAAVLEAATGPQPLVLAGHSLGGMTVLDLLARRPETVGDRLRGVALLSTTSSARAETALLELGITGAARFERVVRMVLPWLRDPRVYEVSGRVYSSSSDLSYLLTRWWATGRAAAPAVVDLTEQLVLDSDPDVIAGMTEAVLNLDLDEALTCLRVPTRILVGAQDRLTPVSLSRRMAARCAHAELVELPDVGHMAPLEAPATVNAVLEDLLLDRTSDAGEVADGGAGGGAAA
jgi:pimeloyl-ACP methyl ester carboxylesterase